jgi:hypothetical protein
MNERNGIQIEMKKHSLKQLQSGDWIVSFTASQIDFPTELATAAMGQRFMAVLVPLGDFEDVPASQKPENKHKLSQQAAMMCDDKRFWKFLEHHGARLSVSSEYLAREAVCKWCDIESRAELDTNPEAAARWRNLRAEYEAWLRT